MTSFAADVAVSREFATLILSRPIRIALDLKARAFLAIALRLLPASALALALVLLVPSLWLGAAWLAGPTTATALLALISPHECQVVPLSD